MSTDDLEDGSAYVKDVGRPELSDGEEDEEDALYNAKADAPNWGAMGPLDCLDCRRRLLREGSAP